MLTFLLGLVYRDEEEFPTETILFYDNPTDQRKISLLLTFGKLLSWYNPALPNLYYHPIQPGQLTFRVIAMTE